jgi:hypothetical protein
MGGTAVKAALIIIGLFTIGRYLIGLLLWEAGSETLKQSPSPDGATTAYLLRFNPGAMSSFIYAVRLSPSGTGPEEGRTIIRGARLKGLDFRWTGVRSLKVRVPCGDYSDATNFFGDGGRDLWISVEFDFEVCPETKL